MSASGSSLDDVLIHQACESITPANVHRINRWIFCYENSTPDSKARSHYENLLRWFVRQHSGTAGIWQSSGAARIA
jgi:hypothetical protein